MAAFDTARTSSAWQRFWNHKLHWKFLLDWSWLSKKMPTTPQIRRWCPKT